MSCGDGGGCGEGEVYEARLERGGGRGGEVCMGESFVKEPWGGGGFEEGGEQELPAGGTDVCWGGHFCSGLGEGGQWRGIGSGM